MRDVERAMKVITWFYSNSELIARVVEEDDNGAEESSEDESGEDDDVDSDNEEQVEQVSCFKLIILAV